MIQLTAAGKRFGPKVEPLCGRERSEAERESAGEIPSAVFARGISF